MSKKEDYAAFYRDFDMSGFNVLEGCPKELRLAVLLREVMLARELDDIFPKIYFPGDKIPPRIGFSGEEI